MVLNPLSWEIPLLYFPIAAIERWRKTADAYQDEGVTRAEAEWKAFLFVKDDMKRFEERNPDKPLPYRNPSEEEIQHLKEHYDPAPIDFQAFDHYQIPISSASEFRAYLDECKREFDSVRSLAEKLAEIEADSKVGKLKLEKRTTNHIISKPKHAVKPKSAKSARRKPGRHDEGTGSLF